ncbi:hypothetical protein psal_cds_828 [Pandoravirus salinus]|uniref:Uncharacterized protein n=1 Tax=Pandoravirus salinus TaxID=1349410 RepID=S4VZD1_9VIRU|nr:hypothetical protein psal_cds_828 [Pandoravirus salinus]AGO84866.1 hypothetical protein psal_cds_828 [Pandoravirus salinus]
MQGNKHTAPFATTRNGQSACQAGCPLSTGSRQTHISDLLCAVCDDDADRVRHLLAAETVSLAEILFTRDSVDVSLPLDIASALGSSVPPDVRRDGWTLFDVAVHLGAVRTITTITMMSDSLQKPTRTVEAYLHHAVCRAESGLCSLGDDHDDAGNGVAAARCATMYPLADVAQALVASMPRSDRLSGDDPNPLTDLRRRAIWGVTQSLSNNVTHAIRWIVDEGGWTLPEDDQARVFSVGGDEAVALLQRIAQTVERGLLGDNMAPHIDRLASLVASRRLDEARILAGLDVLLAAGYASDSDVGAVPLVWVQEDWQRIPKDWLDNLSERVFALHDALQFESGAKACMDKDDLETWFVDRVSWEVNVAFVRAYDRVAARPPHSL